MAFLFLQWLIPHISLALIYPTVLLVGIPLKLSKLILLFMYYQSLCIMQDNQIKQLNCTSHNENTSQHMKPYSVG